MKTRHLHKKLRSFGLSKHDARKVTAMARSAGITNAEALEVFSAVMLIGSIVTWGEANRAVIRNLEKLLALTTAEEQSVRNENHRK